MRRHLGSCGLGQCNLALIHDYTYTEVLCFSMISSPKKEKIIEQQLLLDQLGEELAKFNLSMTSSVKENCGDGPDARISDKRPHTVPFGNYWGHHVYSPSRQDSKQVSHVSASVLLRSSGYLDYLSVCKVSGGFLCLLDSWTLLYVLFLFSAAKTKDQ